MGNGDNGCLCCCVVEVEEMVAGKRETQKKNDTRLRFKTFTIFLLSVSIPRNVEQTKAQNVHNTRVAAAASGVENARACLCVGTKSTCTTDPTNQQMRQSGLAFTTQVCAIACICIDITTLTKQQQKEEQQNQNKHKHKHSKQ